MGQHKHNPVAQAAERGELPPKPPRMSAAAIRRRVLGMVEEATGMNKLMVALNGKLPADHPMLEVPRGAGELGVSR